MDDLNNLWSKFTNKWMKPKNIQKKHKKRTTNFVETSDMHVVHNSITTFNDNRFIDSDDSIDWKLEAEKARKNAKDNFIIEHVNNNPIFHNKYGIKYQRERIKLLRKDNIDPVILREEVVKLMQLKKLFHIAKEASIVVIRK